LWLPAAIILVAVFWEFEFGSLKNFQVELVTGNHNPKRDRILHGFVLTTVTVLVMHFDIGLVARSVSEGNCANSLAHASGYQSCI
jgi:Cft2 family RNA processing exonuclease